MTIKKVIINSLLIVLTSAACTTVLFESEPIEGSLAEIQKAISENLPNGLGAVSANQRLFYSKEYKSGSSGQGKVSLVMRVGLLGDRRPYTIQINVRRAANTSNIIQAYDNGEDYDQAEGQAKRTYSKIKEQLTKRQGEKNLFDDFRPF
jgi:hypothetical protein